MAWGLPPTFTVSETFSAFDHEQLIDMSTKILDNLGYSVTSTTPYTAQAYKKIGFTFLSFFNFTRPRLNVSIRADEDRKFTIEITYTHSNNSGAAFNDLGKSKKHALEIMSKMKN